MKKKIAIVSGGAGFIGSHMSDLLLSKGFKVIVIDDLSGGHKKNIAKHLNAKNLILIKKNIIDLKYKDLKTKEAKYFFHFAGKGDIVPSIENPFEYFNTNVMGTVNALQLSRKLKIKKFVYAASSSCYGLANTPTKEDHKIDPKYPYALSKYMGENLVFHWSRVYGLNVSSVRIFNAYGPRVKTTGAYGAVFGVFFKQKLMKKPFTLVGNGKQKRDFLYVTDVAQAFYKVALSTNKKYKIFNLGSGNPQSILKLIKLIGGKYIKIPKRPGEPDVTWANIKKIKNVTGWKPIVKFENGVEEMLKNINYWNNAPLWKPANIKKATKSWFKYIK